MKPDVRLVLFALPMLLVACDEGPTTPTAEPAPGIVGQVLDVEGNPAVGAPVGVILGLRPVWTWVWPPDEFGREDGCDPSGAGVGYLIPLEEPSLVTAHIVNHAGEIFRTIVENELLAAGTHGFTWNKSRPDGSPAPNGVYGIRVSIVRPGYSNGFLRVSYMINELSLDYVDCAGPAVITDADGRFRIPYDQLPLGWEVSCGLDQLCTVPDSLWIQSAQGIGRVRQALTLTDLENDREITLRMDYLPD